MSWASLSQSPERNRDRDRDRETESQRDRETERQRDRDRETETERAAATLAHTAACTCRAQTMMCCRKPDAVRASPRCAWPDESAPTPSSTIMRQPTGGTPVDPQGNGPNFLPCCPPPCREGEVNVKGKQCGKQEVMKACAPLPKGECPIRSCGLPPNLGIEDCKVGLLLAFLVRCQGLCVCCLVVLVRCACGGVLFQRRPALTCVGNVGPGTG
eukprot:317290-Rhodomonas_salina.2